MKGFSAMVGKRLVAIEGCEVSSDKVVFRFDDGTSCHLWHNQGCCEYVRVEDVAGDPQDLVGHTVVSAEEVDSDDWESDTQVCGSHTWTFYKVATQGGYITIRWLGESNGYYSEAVDVYWL